MQPQISPPQEMTHRPAHWISRAARQLWRLGDLRLKPLGFTTSQMPVLFALKGGVEFTQKELAQMARIEQPSMAQLLARMKRDGLIEATTDPSDRRSARIRLSATALDRLPAVRTAMEEGNAQAMAGLDEEEIATLNRLLQRVVANLEQAADAAAGREN